MDSKSSRFDQPSWQRPYFDNETWTPSNSTNTTPPFLPTEQGSSENLSFEKNWKPYKPLTTWQQTFESRDFEPSIWQQQETFLSKTQKPIPPPPGFAHLNQKQTRLEAMNKRTMERYVFLRTKLTSLEFLKNLITECGELKAIYFHFPSQNAAAVELNEQLTREQYELFFGNQTENLMIFEYFDLRHAEQAYQKLSILQQPICRYLTTFEFLLLKPSLQLFFTKQKRSDGDEEEGLEVYGNLLFEGFRENMTEREVKKILKGFGDVFMVQKMKKFLFVSFYDSRDAIYCHQNLNEIHFQGRMLLCAFCPDFENLYEFLQKGSHQIMKQQQQPEPKEQEVQYQKLPQLSFEKQLPVKQKKKNDLEIDLFKIMNGEDLRTTFMIRNIPNKYTQEMLLELINETHKGQYDFLYLRMDFKNRCNVGYAFINFPNPKSVVTFALKICGRRWTKFNSDKICSLTYATVQGRDALIQKFRDSSVMQEEKTFRPKLFYTSGDRAGEEEPFPESSRGSQSSHGRDMKVDEQLSAMLSSSHLY